MNNKELYDLRIVICLKESKVYVEGISVCKVIEKLVGHGQHCLPCSYTNDIMDLLPQQLRNYQMLC